MRALWLALAPAALTVVPSAAAQALVERFLPSWVFAGAGISLVLLMSATFHREGSRVWRLLATLAFLAFLLATLLARPDEPGRGLVLMLSGVAFYAYVWPPEQLRRADHRRLQHPPELEAQLTAMIASLFGLDAWLQLASGTLVSVGALTALFLVPVVFAVRRRVPARPAQWAVLGLAALAALAPLIVVASVQASGQPFPSLSGYVALGVLSPLLVLGLASRHVLLRRFAASTVARDPDLIDVVVNNPARVLVVSFAAICAVGTLLLELPISSAPGVSLAWMDAAFTSVSATCVTGLVVVDTPTVFSPFGQVVVLALIQVGGLGIMVFSAAAVVFLGRRMSLSHERAAVDLIGATGRAGLRDALRTILLVTLGTEAVAALLLTGSFLAHGDSFGEALWRGVFTAVSAFCNAGFALQTDNLVPYAHSPFALGVVGTTIVAGGLGPSVVAALVAWRVPARRTLHARLVLVTTLLLIVAPWVLVAALEWDNTLAGMSVVDKLSNALFQSVTLRTAGFNSIDLTQIHPATLTLMVLVMFVGGSPGSTAGGAKTTTLAVVVLAIFAVVRGRERIEVFGRTLPTVTLMRATAVTTLGVFASCVGLAAVQITQDIPLDAAVFEVVSALATVGLSVGATALLDDLGKAIIMACMFAGRVGPLTLFVFLAAASADHTGRVYPEESVPVG